MARLMVKSIFTVSLLAILLAVPAFAASINKSIKIEAGSDASGASSVNGSVTVGKNATVRGNVKTVNGSVRVDEGATIEDASTVNGGVRVSDHVRARNLSTVNGTIRVGKDVSVAGEIEAVNGKIKVANGSAVADGVSNVNGVIEITGAEIGGDVSTVSGDILLSGKSIVRGDLVVEKPSNWSWNNGKKRKPRIVVGPGSVVEGTIRLEREVDLFISESADVGGVEGEMSMDDAVRFSGETPQG